MINQFEWKKGAEVKNGISAFKRTETIAKIADKNSTKATFSTTGHIFPLIAHEGGVVCRQGQTEVAVELCKLCNLNEVGVICEIIKEEGHMARTEDLKRLSQLWDINVITIKEIVAYVQYLEQN